MELEDLKAAFGEHNEAVKGMSGKLDGLAKRLESMEVQAARIPLNGKGNGGEFITHEQREEKAAFESWLRDPKSQKRAVELEQRAVTIADNPGGGYAVPEVLADQIAKRLRDLSPVRQVARVISVSSSDFKMLVDVNGTASGWVGEGDTRTETGTPQLGEVAPTFGTVYALPKASEESMADIRFDVGNWLVSSASEELAIQEGAAFISGNGTKKPTGFLNGTPEATGDNDSPARGFGTLEYIPTGSASGFGSLSTTSPEFYPADVLWTTVYTLRSGYRANAVWMMNSATAGVIRKFKDADGNYLWRDGLQAGQPPLLCGYRVIIAEDMPDIGANAHPVAFGDFQRGYLIADSFGLRITMDENITTPGQTRFYVRKRVGGKVLDDNAIKLIKCAVS